MPHRDHSVVALAVLLLAGTLQSASSAPQFELTEDGRTFLYRARPGEPPAKVAESFAVPEDRFAAFLTTNGITDPTRIPVGFEYRIPNPLGPQLEALAGQVDQLERAVAARTVRVVELERAFEELQAQATLSDEKERRLVALEARWPIAITALVTALLGLAGALWVARLAVARLTGVQHRAHALDHELEERRRAGLVERQEAGHRIVELENRVRQLECQPRLVTGGRG